jgi:hypothetical protein
MKLLFKIAAIVFLVLSIHLGYEYVHSVSEKVPTKWGTIVEGVVGKFSYLPYTSTNSVDEFYQHLLFKWCIKSVVSGSVVTQQNDLCDVVTRDYKNYFVTIPSPYRRIDDQSFTLDDVFFTYQTILKDNIWKIPDLNSYSKAEIIRTDDNTIKVSFPKQSVDNILFFTHPLLPKHVLEGQNLDYYLKTFAKQPIYISCAILDLVKSRDKNFVFDITSCPELYPKIIQVKSFEDQNQAISYMQKENNIIDYASFNDMQSEDTSTSGVLGATWTGMGIPTNTLYTMFYNINTVSENLRKWLSHGLSSLQYDNLLYHQTLFSFPLQTGFRLKDLIASQSISTGSNSGSLNAAFPFLPKNIWIFWKGKYKEYYLDELRDKYLIQFKFDTKYDKITIAANGPYEFTPDSYDVENKSCAYNLSLQYKNIKKWTNTYIIYGYLRWVQIKLLTMKVHYGVKPSVIPLVTKKTNYSVVYLDEPNSKLVSDTIKEYFIEQWMDANVTWLPYSNFNEFEGKIASKSYDMVLLPLELWMKKDLSALFSDNTTLNPSQYSNDRVVQLLQKYTNGSKSSSNEILTTYQKVYPFVMLWSLKQLLFVKSLYSDKFVWPYFPHSFRQSIVNTLKTYETIVINKDKLLERQTFVDYIKSKL